MSLFSFIPDIFLLYFYLFVPHFDLLFTTLNLKKTLFYTKVLRSIRLFDCVSESLVVHFDTFVPHVCHILIWNSSTKCFDCTISYISRCVTRFCLNVPHIFTSSVNIISFDCQVWGKCIPALWRKNVCAFVQNKCLKRI